MLQWPILDHATGLKSRTLNPSFTRHFLTQSLPPPVFFNEQRKREEISNPLVLFFSKLFLESSIEIANKFPSFFKFYY